MREEWAELIAAAIVVININMVRTIQYMSCAIPTTAKIINRMSIEIIKNMTTPPG